MIRASLGIHRLPVATALAVLCACNAAPSSRAPWGQWGGPNQDFAVETTGLADQWPEKGPERIWERELGDGYSAILADGGRLYTMYRSEDKETVIAMDAQSGKTVWEYKYDSAPHEGHVEQFGGGPRSTPLLYGDRLYTIGVAGKMHCLNKENGKVYWTHDLWGSEFNGTILNHGYSNSPVAYKNTIIVMVGGEGTSLVAFDKNDGHVVWKSQDFANSYSTPKLINVGGEDQLACYMGSEMVGIDPNNGDLKWRFDHENRWKQNVCMPMWDGKDTLFFSNLHSGSHGLKLTRVGNETKAEELWSTRKIQFYHVTSVRVGDYIYGLSGQNTPCFFSAINMKTGKIAWRKRGFSNATTILADGKLIILDSDGTLALAKATPEEFKVLSKASIVESVAWTVPTLVGKTLYVRDKKKIMALDLG